MLRILVYFSLLFAGSLLLNANFLSPAEADAIIEARESAKLERAAERLAELEKAEVLSEGQTILPDGRRVIVREVVPPVSGGSQASPAKPAPAVEYTAEQLDRIKAQGQLRQDKVLMLSCTVYDGSLTELRWKHADEDYLAYTNANFNYLRGVMTVESETGRYDYFMGIGDAPVYQDRSFLPKLSAFEPDQIGFILTKGDPSKAEATAGLEALLAHYDTHLPALKVEHQRRLALTEAKKRYDAAHPKEPEPFVMQVWVPGKEAAE